MSEQLALDLDAAPRKARTAVLRSAYFRSSAPMPEILAREDVAAGQDARVLALFRAVPGRRFTPSQILDLLIAEGESAPLLTSVRRSISGLTERGLLAHFPADRVAGPRGASESRWASS